MLPYRYNVGNVVQTARTSPWRDVVWRGRQWVPGHDGKPRQVNVYRLRGPYWDCYYESELQSAGRWLD
jgi:hypothetical protein